MLSYLKVIGAGLFVASLIILGWKAHDWRTKANLLEVARLELRAEQQRRIEAVAAKNTAQTELAELRLRAKEAKIGEGVKIVTKTIREYIHDTAPCRISAPVSNSLRDLRAGVMPTAPTQPTVGRAAP